MALKTVHLTRTGVGGGRWGVGSIQHSGPLADAEIVELSGARVTSLSRTVTDLARTESFGSAVCVADHALRTVAGVAVYLKEALNAAHHRPGAGAARRALRFADGRAESPGESRARVLMELLGLAAPELQSEVFDSGNKFVGRTDLALVDKGVLIEFDGMGKYGDLLRGDLTPQQVLAAEKRREDGLRGLGWLVVRITWSDFDDPGSVTLRLNGAIGRGQRVVAVNGLMGSVRLRPPICLPR